MKETEAARAVLLEVLNALGAMRFQIASRGLGALVFFSESTKSSVGPVVKSSLRRLP